MTTKLTIADKCDIALQSVTIPMLLEEYGYHVKGKNKRIQCPFNGCSPHSKDAFSFDRKLFHCFSCGVKGNAISFVTQIENCDTEMALDILNRRFRLWSDEPPKNFKEYLDRKNTVSKIRYQNKEKREEFLKQKRKENEEKRIIQEYRHLKEQAEKFKPKSIEDIQNPNPTYAKILKKLTYYEYLYDEMLM